MCDPALVGGTPAGIPNRRLQENYPEKLLDMNRLWVNEKENIDTLKASEIWGVNPLTDFPGISTLLGQSAALK